MNSLEETRDSDVTKGEKTRSKKHSQVLTLLKLNDGNNSPSSPSSSRRGSLRRTLTEEIKQVQRHSPSPAPHRRDRLRRSLTEQLIKEGRRQSSTSPTLHSSNSLRRKSLSTPEPASSYYSQRKGSPSKPRHRSKNTTLAVLTCDLSPTSVSDPNQKSPSFGNTDLPPIDLSLLLASSPSNKLTSSSPSLPTIASSGYSVDDHDGTTCKSSFCRTEALSSDSSVKLSGVEGDEEVVYDTSPASARKLLKKLSSFTLSKTSSNLVVGSMKMDRHPQESTKVASSSSLHTPSGGGTAPKCLLPSSKEVDQQTEERTTNLIRKLSKFTLHHLEDTSNEGYKKPQCDKKGVTTSSCNDGGGGHKQQIHNKPVMIAKQPSQQTSFKTIIMSTLRKHNILADVTSFTNLNDEGGPIILSNDDDDDDTKSVEGKIVKSTIVKYFQKNTLKVTRTTELEDEEDSTLRKILWKLEEEEENETVRRLVDSNSRQAIKESAHWRKSAGFVVTANSRNEDDDDDDDDDCDEESIVDYVDREFSSSPFFDL